MDDAVKAWLEHEHHHILRQGDDNYPELLQQIPDPPETLYINGNPEVLNLPALAIVGSRNPTRSGERSARDFAAHLGSSGFCIVSGLAQGIDTAAHRGALQAGAPTVAFLGTGIDRIYPAANRELAHEIVRQGALVSEFPLGAAPERWHFPRRNRLISGLSIGTLVVEAARKSGSLITARLAAEQGREVFAMPGSIHNPLARGCHQLLRSGAKLVESSEDILAELAPLIGHMLQTAESTAPAQESDAPPDPEYAQLLQALQHDPCSIEQLSRQSELTIEQVSSMLLILELEGKVEALPGGRYALLSSAFCQTP